ncbi:MAG: hypothetical protein FWG74_08000, partial [Planctomycetes bacterium]|nr:hypothetical protein [Planctomycetota bacterium]
EDAALDAFFENNADEIALRQSRRNEYLAYRQAETDIHLNHPELARGVLEEIANRVDSLRREELRRTIIGDFRLEEAERRVFELGPDEYRMLALLLGRSYDDLGMQERAKSWYRRFLSNEPEDRNQAFVVERLAVISVGEGDVYRRANPEHAAAYYETALDYYQALFDSTSATREQRNAAILGLATVNSRLAALTPVEESTGIDELTGLGRIFAGWLEEFSGQPLPHRTLSIPAAVGNALAKPELVLPELHALAGVASGTFFAMAGGRMVTPYERRRRYLTQAIENYDYAAAVWAGDELGERAHVLAARESWELGLKTETVARFEKMLDPLSPLNLFMAARLGLATAALDRGDLRRAHLLILGGHIQLQPLWFTHQDTDWRRFAGRLGNPANRSSPGPWLRVWETIPEEGREISSYAARGRRLDDEYVVRFLRALNTMLRREGFYAPEYFSADGNRNFYLRYLLAMPHERLPPEDIVWRNRLLMEEAWPYELSQKGVKDVFGFPPLPPARELAPDALVSGNMVRDLLMDLGQAWVAAAAGRPEVERFRMILNSVDAYEAALGSYGGDPGVVFYQLARNRETLADIRENQGRHLEAMFLTAEAGRNYLDVSFQARGSQYEMESLLAAGDAFFRAGLLERTIESQRRFQERFGFSSLSGSESAMAVVRSENLLGRAYWFLGDMPNALESFKRNIPRRTPDRFKSIYYIGRVLLDEGLAQNNPDVLGSISDPLPELDRNNDPILVNAFHAFNYLRQNPSINPAARAWRWSTFDLAKLEYIFAEQARKEWEESQNAAAQPPTVADGAKAWLALYDAARARFTEALERYPLRRNGGAGLSVTVEPADYADVMVSRFESEYLLAKTLLTLAEARRDDSLLALARAHLENLRDRNRYAGALFDLSLNRFQLNAAIIREELGVNGAPLERSRLGDDEGPTYSPTRLRNMLRNSMLLLADEYYRAGEAANLAARQVDASEEIAIPLGAAAGFFRRSYDVYQDVYDRFGIEDGAQAMVGMGDSLSRLGRIDDAANHYRMARNIAGIQPPETRADGLLAIGPAFWGGVAESRLRDMAGGDTVS